MITLATTSERIVARKDGAIGWMIFNNPAKHNAISMDMAEAVPAVMREFEDDPAERDLARAQAMLDARFLSADYVEGRNALATRRKPQFKRK